MSIAKTAPHRRIDLDQFQGVISAGAGLAERGQPGNRGVQDGIQKMREFDILAAQSVFADQA